jgi:CRP/FNR family transcriptional regulator, cyclic AMP receptor protein
VRAALQNVPIFAGLNEAALTLLWDSAKEIKTPAGEVVVREGETGNRLFVVGEGQVRVCKQFGQPGEVELAKLAPGNFFGEMCILETLPRSATVQAITDATFYTLTSLSFYHLYEQMPAQHSILVLNIARDVSRRLRHLDEAFAARH